MALDWFSEDTLDDAMRVAIKAILNHGRSINPSKGPAKELIGAAIEVTNPRARLSRTETRGRLFSGLGELCWYLAGSNDLEFIKYYIQLYEKFAENGKLFGAYGPRLFQWSGLNQFKSVADALQSKDTRQAVIQLFDRNDIIEEHKDVPCTCTFQFILRDNHLHLVTYMRSNDAYLGLPHDVFCFTMLQEIMAAQLSVQLGSYKHLVGSFHLYEDNLAAAEQFLEEGWQSTIGVAMPPMPLGDPIPSITALLTAERSLRVSEVVDQHLLNSMDPYWADLVRLLDVFGCKKHDHWTRIGALRDQMASDVYRVFIDRMIENRPDSSALLDTDPG